MCSHRVISKEVPDHVGIFQMGLRVALLRVDKHLKLMRHTVVHFFALLKCSLTYQERITNEEYRRVVAH
jgi:hypothetical protein